HEPKYQSIVMDNYLKYLENPTIKFENPTEVELLAYEVGRLSNTKRIYAIDYQEGYNYSIGYQVKDAIDKQTYMDYMQMLSELEKEFPEDEMTLIEKLKFTNTPFYLDMLMNINADMLTHISTEGKSQRSEEH